MVFDRRTRSSMPAPTHPAERSPRVIGQDGRMRPVLVVVGGLPGVGKSTIASLLAERTGTPYLRVDRIEQAIIDWSELRQPIGPAGYAVAHALATEQLRLGLDVVVECVNPLAVTRDAWPATAIAAGAAVVEVEVVCSDPAEHRRRVESRPTDVAGLEKPSWAEICALEYASWSRRHLVLDSTRASIESAVVRVRAAMASARESEAAPARKG
jgi:predicted kinase